MGPKAFVIVKDRIFEKLAAFPTEELADAYAKRYVLLECVSVHCIFTNEKPVTYYLCCRENKSYIPTRTGREVQIVTHHRKPDQLLFDRLSTKAETAIVREL
jgi:hypothetical protein